LAVSALRLVVWCWTLSISPVLVVIWAFSIDARAAFTIADQSVMAAQFFLVMVA
jgi:hypothetical protein